VSELLPVRVLLCEWQPGNNRLSDGKIALTPQRLEEGDPAHAIAHLPLKEHQEKPSGERQFSITDKEKVRL
jgi:hypothetical protein